MSSQAIRDVWLYAVPSFWILVRYEHLLADSKWAKAVVCFQRLAEAARSRFLAGWVWLCGAACKRLFLTLSSADD